MFSKRRKARSSPIPQSAFEKLFGCNNDILLYESALSFEQKIDGVVQKWYHYLPICRHNEVISELENREATYNKRIMTNTKNDAAVASLDTTMCFKKTLPDTELNWNSQEWDKYHVTLSKQNQSCWYTTSDGLRLPAIFYSSICDTHRMRCRHIKHKKTRQLWTLACINEFATNKAQPILAIILNDEQVKLLPIDLYHDNAVPKWIPPLEAEIDPFAIWQDVWKVLDFSGWTGRMRVSTNHADEEIIFVKPFCQTDVSLDGVGYFTNLADLQDFAHGAYGWKGPIN